MYCANCGTQNADDAANCVNCKNTLGPPSVAQNINPANTALPAQQNNTEKIESHLALAIVCFILFWLVGVVAIIYAARVSTLVASGDIEGAKKSSKNAKIWGWIGIIISIVIIILYVIAAFITASSGKTSTH